MSPADWASKDFYKVLGVSKDASPEDIKKAYRKLARANHPDSKPGDAAAEERFKSISEAYSVLSDADRRKEYDEQRTLFGSGGFRVPPPGQGPRDFNDLFGGGGGAGAERVRSPPGPGHRVRDLPDVRAGARGQDRLPAPVQRRRLCGVLRHGREGGDDPPRVSAL
jgi:molecular chaperone DnaJ